MPESNALVLEILRQDSQLKMGLFEQKEIVSTLRHYSQCAVSFKETQGLCQEIISILNKTDKKGLLDPDLMKGLRKAGQLLWDHLLTKPVKDRLKNSQGFDLILCIDEELINIPWELLYDGNNFLCLVFNLGRVVRTKEQLTLSQYRSPAGIPKMLILANPTNDLRSAYLEGVFIRNQFDRKRKEIGIDFKSTGIGTLYVKKNLHDYDIVHFAGHCEYDPKDPQNTGWILDDGKLTAQDILAMGQTISLPALVFSNACHSAESSCELIGLDYQEKSYSLASAFLFSGVRHYIGAVRKIEDPVSLVFAKEFYTQLISGKPVGECVRLSRLRLINEYGLAAIAWTSYLLYGDPNFALFRLKAKPVMPRLKRDTTLYKKQIAWSSLAIIIISICICLFMWLPTINPSIYILFRKSHKLFTEGKNHEVILTANRIIKKDPMFLAVYPLVADAYQRLGKAEEALRHYFNYAIFSEQRHDKKNLAQAYLGIGWVYHLQGDYPKAFDFYHKAINLSRENKDKLNEAIALRKLAVWHIDKEKLDDALELLMKSSEINHERQKIYGHKYNLACDYFDIGLVFTDKDDYESAKEFYKKSQAIFEKLNLKNELSDNYFNLGEVYLFEKQYQKALDCYKKGLKIDQEHDNKASIASDYNMFGELYMAMNDLNEAERFFLKSIVACQKIDAQPDLADAYYNLGILYKQKKQEKMAREYLRLAEEIYSRIDTVEYKKTKQELLSLD